MPQRPPYPLSPPEHDPEQLTEGGEEINASNQLMQMMNFLIGLKQLSVLANYIGLPDTSKSLMRILHESEIEFANKIIPADTEGDKP